MRAPRARGLAALLLVLGFALPGHAAEEPGVDSADWGSEYDAHFQKYSKRYFGPGFDWRWFKAQAIAESRLNPKAQSGVGAVGLMQLMPSTYAEIRKLNPHFEDIRTPRWNIAAGIYYDRYLFTQRAWDGIADEEKILMALASYNAGLGGVLKAAGKARPQPASTWEQLAQHAPAETRGYVARISRLKGVAGGKLRDPRQKGISRRYGKG